ncbi:MAG: GNAT family N-acetyltransferase [Rhodothermus sp.]|nr:GNAT family N-acetyltransferase [Rhodothermus sp.]
MEQITIRPARWDDAEALETLWWRLLEEQAALDPTFAPAADARRRWRNDFMLWVRDRMYRLLVAEHSRELIGFISAHQWSPPPIYRQELEVYINELYVLPGYRRQGIGAQLVAAVRAWAQEIGAVRLRLGVLAANREGLAFWERQQARPFSITLTIPLTDFQSRALET